MTSIGAFQFTTFQGFMLPATQRVGTIDSDVGTDGNGVVFGGWSCEVIGITTQVDVTSAEEAFSLGQQYSAIRATVVTVTDQFGKNWEDCLVMDVRTTYAQTLSGFRVMANWRVMPKTERPPGVAGA